MSGYIRLRPGMMPSHRVRLSTCPPVRPSGHLTAHLAVRILVG